MPSNPASIRPERVIPDTSTKTDYSRINAEVAHEESLRYFLERSELGVLDKDQMGIMSLVQGCKKLGIDLPATEQFFETQRQLSSGEDGKARIQAKEVITAGSFPMSLLFGEQKSGWADTIKSLLTGKKAEPQQQTMR